MNMLPESGYAHAILDLYRIAQSKNVADFPEAAIEWMRKFVDFDMALLGLLSRQPGGKIRAHFGHLVNESAPVLDEWVDLMDKDKVVSHMVNNVGRAFSFRVQKQFKEFPQILDFAIRSRHLNVLAAASNYGAHHMMAGLSLRRADAAWVFTPAESQVLELLLPHVAEAFRINRSLFSRFAIGIQGATVSTGVCVCTRHGHIIYQDENFDLLARPMLNGRNFHKLPAAMNEALGCHETSVCAAGSLLFSSRRIGQLRVVMVRPANSIDTLTPRERSVAKFYGGGLTHKEIGIKLSISPATARRHVESIYAKLEIHTKTDLVSRLQDQNGDLVLGQLGKVLES